MKNEQIIAAWDSILPDAAAEARMRTNILARRQQGRRYLTVKRTAALAACLLLVCGALFSVRHHWFGAARYSVTLETGETVVYESGEGSPAADSMIAPFPVQTRSLTAEELHTLFPAAEIAGEDAAFAHFKEETGEMVAMEGRLGGVRIHLAREGVPITDTIIEGEEHSTEIGGTAVKTGYALANSGGKKVAIFFAEYTQDGTTVHAELAGVPADGDQLCRQLTEMVCGMIRSHAPDCSAVRY